jgi:hypothetical protein
LFVSQLFLLMGGLGPICGRPDGSSYVPYTHTIFRTWERWRVIIKVTYLSVAKSEDRDFGRAIKYEVQSMLTAMYAVTFAFGTCGARLAGEDSIAKSPVLYSKTSLLWCPCSLGELATRE